MDSSTETFLLLFCEKNSDGTKNLRLKGEELHQRNRPRVCDEDMRSIVAFLNEHREVVRADLCYNRIRSDGIVTFVEEYLSKENNLIELNLTGCDIRCKGIGALVSAKDTLKLRTLRLNGNKIGDKGYELIAELLKNNKTIEHIDLAEADQTLTGVVHITNILRDGVGSNVVKVIDISRVIRNFNRYPYQANFLAQNIGDILKVNSTLIEIHLQKCGFDGHDMELMMHGLKKNETLKFLDLGYNRIGDPGIELLANFVATRPPLLGLNVAGNGIGNTGARALSFGLPFSRIRILDISHNKITDIGMLDILNTIKKPVVMRLLYIWGNEITHPTNIVIHRMLLSGVLNQEFIDVQVYQVDKVYHAAYVRNDRYKHLYYCEMDYACATELKILHHHVVPEDPVPKEKIDFKFHPRLPPVSYV